MLRFPSRNVTFKYPRSEKVALENVSLKIGQGDMCVIVGTNGSGMSLYFDGSTAFLNKMTQVKARF